MDYIVDHYGVIKEVLGVNYSSYRKPKFHNTLLGGSGRLGRGCVYCSILGVIQGLYGNNGQEMETTTMGLYRV